MNPKPNSWLAVLKNQTWWGVHDSDIPHFADVQSLRAPSDVPFLTMSAWREKKTRKNAVRRDHLSSESRSPFVVQKKTFAICSMYGIFTYVWDRMAVLFGQMLVNIPYLEHIGSVYKFAKNGELLWIARWGFKMFLDVLSMYFEPDLEWWYAINVHIWLWNNHSNTINNDQHHLSTKPSLRTWSCMRTYTCIIQIYCDDVCVCALYIHIISVCVYNYNIIYIYI